MAQYEEYFADLAGKTIQSDYLFHVAGDSQRDQYVYSQSGSYDNNGVVEYRGGPISLEPSSLSGGQIVPIDIQTGVFTLAGSTYQFVGASENSQQLFFRPVGQGEFREISGNIYYTGADLYAISNTGPELTVTTIYDSHFSYDERSPLCFVSGSLISTDRGNIPVEDLVIGDRLVTISGTEHSVSWLGWGTMVVGPSNQPVIIRAHAFSDDSPFEDLRVTSGHGIKVGDVLIPAGLLVNGTSIIFDTASRYVTVFHVASARHVILLANGLHAESYRDDGNRIGFQHQLGSLGSPRSMPTCLPVVTRGPIVARAQSRLSAFASARFPNSVADGARQRVCK
ncbi:hypothetical protein FHS99_002950 [Sphingomonas prati]|uniref:Hedgehog/Intein (Hint) domain-containing protein n=1 Tax=Sphingomonas prati TaxID=1843237 RepID=A0A7W9BUP5_9SPHN|nr:hypothetical protein [Sphingomonas prati]